MHMRYHNLGTRIKSSPGIRIKLFDTVPGDRPSRRESKRNMYFYDLIIDPGTVAEFFRKTRIFNLMNRPGDLFQIFFIFKGKHVAYGSFIWKWFLFMLFTFNSHYYIFTIVKLLWKKTKRVEIFNFF